MTIPRNCLALLVAGLVALMVAGTAQAVQPDEVLSDPALEQRARVISKDLRCLVCQNQSIDDSDASLARDLRILVRERLTAGDSNAEVIDYVVARYGEFVLLKPQFSAQNLLLWGAPVILLLIGGLLMYRYARRPSPVAAEAQLNDDEKKALADILGDRDRDLH